MVSQGYSETFAELLWNRNIHTTDDFSQLIKANIDDLHDPFLMHDMDKSGRTNSKRYHGRATDFDLRRL